MERNVSKVKSCVVGRKWRF